MSGGVSCEASPQNGFQVRLTNFEGPFDLLLQLIFAHRLDVTEVALHRVTDEFIAYTRAIGPELQLEETTAFLVVAATLLDLKAARLLPSGQVDDDEDLALLEEMRLIRPGVKCIVLARHSTPDEVIAAMRARVFACFTPPISCYDVANIASRAVQC